MDDRELLELASRAASMPVEGWTIKPELGMRFVDEDHNFARYWNPLTDDGDAFRLAVTLEIEIVYRPDWARASSDRYQGFLVYEFLIDRKAATRRAIVRAAAKIGEEVIDEELDEPTEDGPGQDEASKEVKTHYERRRFDRSGI